MHLLMNFVLVFKPFFATLIESIGSFYDKFPTFCLYFSHYKFFFDMSTQEERKGFELVISVLLDVVPTD
jgi:hypothetical protein